MQTFRKLPKSRPRRHAGSSKARGPVNMRVQYRAGAGGAGASEWLPSGVGDGVGLRIKLDVQQQERNDDSCQQESGDDELVAVELVDHEDAGEGRDEEAD